MIRNRDAEVARRNRQELIAAKLGRRDLMKLGLLTASGLLVAKRGLSARVAGATSSPPTTPFIAPLPIPPVLEPQASMTPAPQAEPNVAAGNQFGCSVAAVGGNVLVGAPHIADPGAAYLFDGTTGTLLGAFSSPTPSGGDLFGYSVGAVGGNVNVKANAGRGALHEPAPCANGANTGR